MKKIIGKASRILVISSMLCLSNAVLSKELKFVTVDVAPWASYDSEQEKVIGFFADVIKELEQRTKHNIEITLAPFARIDREFESGRQDCTILVTSDKRSLLVDQGATVFYHKIGVIAKKGISLNVYEDLHSLRISVVRGLVNFHPDFDDDENIKKEYDTDYVMGLRKLSRGRIDGIAGAIETIMYLARENGLTDYLGDRLPLLSIPVALQCSKQSKNIHLMRGLSKAIEEMHKDGTLGSIQKKYYY